MGNSAEQKWQLIGGIAATGLALFGIALLVAVVKGGPELWASWVLLVLQILVVVVSAVVVIVLGFWFVEGALDSAASRLAKLENRHKKEITRIRRRAPAIVAVTLLVAEAILLLTDNAFKGEPIPTLTVAFGLLILFWVANELVIRPGRFERVLGMILWLLALPALVSAVLVHRGWDINELIAQLTKLRVETLIFFAFAATLLLVLPLLFSRVRSAAE